jgi:hypothetical protein
LRSGFLLELAPAPYSWQTTAWNAEQADRTLGRVVGRHTSQQRATRLSRTTSTLDDQERRQILDLGIPKKHAAIVLRMIPESAGATLLEYLPRKELR